MGKRKPRTFGPSPQRVKWAHACMKRGHIPLANGPEDEQQFAGKIWKGYICGDCGAAFFREKGSLLFGN